MTVKGFSDANWAALKEEMHDILVGMAKLRQTITYSELASLLQTSYVHHRAPYFHRLIWEMCDDDEAAGHVPLAVLIVRKDTGICGAGYFSAAAAAGADVSDPLAYWQSEFQRVCDYWSEH